MTLRVEFAGQEHPVGRAITEIIGALEADCAALIAAGRNSGAIPPGPPPREMAATYTGVLEAVGSALSGQDPVDIELAERVVRGLLGLPPASNPTVPTGVGPPTPPTYAAMEVPE